MTWTPVIAAMVGALIGTVLAWAASRAWPSLRAARRFCLASRLLGAPFALGYLALGRRWWPDEPAARFLAAMRWLA